MEWRAPSHGRLLRTNVQKWLRLMSSLCVAWFLNFSYICCALWIVVTLFFSTQNIWSCIYDCIFDLIAPSEFPLVSMMFLFLHIFVVLYESSYISHYTIYIIHYILYNINLNFEKLRWTHWWLALSHRRVLCTNVRKWLRLMNSLCVAWFFSFSYICCALWIVVTLSFFSTYNIWSFIYVCIFDLIAPYEFPLFCMILFFHIYFVLYESSYIRHYTIYIIHYTIWSCIY